MIKVLLNCAFEHLEFFKGTILRRNDIELRTESDLDLSLRSIIKSPPSLYLIKGTHPKTVKMHLLTLEDCYSEVPFPVVLMCDVLNGTSLPFFVKKVMPASIDTASFNEAIAELLGLPTRRSSRFAIRLGLNLSRQDRTASANTVNISATGMLVESSIRLTSGEVYQFRFDSLPMPADIPHVSARVVREMPESDCCASTYHYSIEYVGIPIETMETIISKIIH
jgi:hypothetical protein